jgi:hypothetical protein
MKHNGNKVVKKNPYNLRKLIKRCNNQRINIVSNYNLRSRKISRNKPQPVPNKNINNVIIHTFNKNRIDNIINNIKKIGANSNNFTWDDFNNYQSADNINEPANNDFRDWVSATSVKNYLMKDPLIDWFDLYYIKKGYNTITNKETNLFQEEKNKKKQDIETEFKKLHVFFEMGIKFEKEVISYLRNMYPNDIKKVVVGKVNSHLNEITFKYMNEGVPIIEQAAIYNFKNKTYGVADLLIRSDWINKLFQRQILDESEVNIKGSNLAGNYHYRVIDIKWTTMYLCSNGKTIRNSQRFPAYKGQLAIYNSGLGLMQGYTPPVAYILAKSWNLNSGVDEGHNCFTLLGCIDFDNFDKKYLKETYDAIKWVRNVRYNGTNWTCIQPTVPELYPNMCNKYDTPYHKLKCDLANQIDELTQIWMVGIKNRKIAHNNGIYSWSDPNCNSESMGINGKKIGPIVNKIISINRDDIGLISPVRIRNNIHNWQDNHDLDFYIDFEGINGCFYNKEICLENSKADSQLLFLIGIGYEENGSWIYRHFLANDASRNEEKRIVNEFIDFIERRVKSYMVKNKINNRKICKPRLFHWSHAEKSIFGMLDKRHNYQFYKWVEQAIWIDMCKVFIDEPIVIKGAKKFNLKDIAKTMMNNNMISAKWNYDGPDNGLTAMMEAIDYYKYKNNKNKNDEDTIHYEDLMISIIDYNEVDCKVVYEIVNYLRHNHT